MKRDTLVASFRSKRRLFQEIPFDDKNGFVALPNCIVRARGFSTLRSVPKINQNTHYPSFFYKKKDNAELMNSLRNS